MKKNHLARVRQTGVKDQVFAQIRDQIMDHTWPPGAKIPSEKALAETLGVSRVSIREALHMLASLGLLESRQGEGTYVREYTGTIFLNTLLPSIALDKLDILHVLEYRKIVEKGIVSLVVKRAGNAEIIAELEPMHPWEWILHNQRGLVLDRAIRRDTANVVICRIRFRATTWTVKPVS